MKAEIICVGTELLLGDVINTNAAYLAQNLAEMGIYCYHQGVVGDNPSRLKKALQNASSRTDLVILTGGLGPTYDDLTKETLSELLDIPLIRSEVVEQDLHAYFNESQRTMTDNNLKQADVFEGGTVFRNDQGTAPGLAIDCAETTYILLPGPPREMQAMFEKSIKPYLNQLTNSVLISHKLYMFGIGESRVESMLQTHLIEATNPTIAPYATDAYVMLRVTATGSSVDAAEKRIQPVLDSLKILFKDYYYSTDEPSLAKTVVNKLINTNKKISIAESCTGGLLSSLITSVSGSSAVYELGMCTYSNVMKNRFLTVDSHLFDEVGAVSEEVAIAMAKGIRLQAQSDIGVGITGIAGPTGGSLEKPIGLVYICVECDGQCIVQAFHLGHGMNNERTIIQQKAALNALKMIYDLLIQE